MLSVVLAAALAATPTPEELGAINSPVAFVQTCDAARYLDEARREAAASGEVVSRDDEEAAVAFALMGQAFCAAVIQAVAETVLLNPSYEINGERVCVDPSMSKADAIEAMRAKLEADPDAANIPTTAMILRVMADRDACEA